MSKEPITNMSTDPGPRNNGESDSTDNEINGLFFGIAYPFGLSTKAHITQQITLSLVPDFTFVTSASERQRFGENWSSVKDDTDINIIKYTNKRDGGVKIGVGYQSDSGLDNDSGNARRGMEGMEGGKMMVATSDTTPGMLGDSDLLIPDNKKNSNPRRSIEGAITTAGGPKLLKSEKKSSWWEEALEGATKIIKTSTLRSKNAKEIIFSMPKYEKNSWSEGEVRGVHTMTGALTFNSPKIEGKVLSMSRDKENSRTEGTTDRKITITKIPITESTKIEDIPSSTWEDKESPLMEGTMAKTITIKAVSVSNSKTISNTTLTTSKYKEQSWSSDDSEGGVMLADSVKPLNGQARSLVSPTPIRDEIGSGCDTSSSCASGSEWRILRDQSISPTNDRAIPCDNAPGSTLHFHRKEHHVQHEHHQSMTPGPFTCTKTRRYMLSGPEQPLPGPRKVETDIDELTSDLQNLALQRRLSGWVYSPASLQEALKFLQYDREFMCSAAELEARNRFRGIDMNEGWNRAAATLWNFTIDASSFVPYNEGGSEIRMKITESLNRFSLWAQLEPIEWDPVELKGMFDKVFVGEGLGNSGWARKPGSWWGQRKKIFDGHRGRNFLQEIDMWIEKIEDGLEKWKSEHNAMSSAIGSLKRKASSAKSEVDVEGNNCRKRVKLPKTKSEQVMSEAWRARRRMQEKRAGRWTDGTLRMDRMWAGFHWVLNADDPKDEVWPREVFERTYLY
jgi:hypothetical protein